MPDRSLASRVENLERRVGLLEALPERVTAVELQIVQLRSEMREHFSAVRKEFREEIRSATSDLRAEIQAGDDETRQFTRALDEETRRYMRVLHEEVLSRITLIQDGLPRRRKR